MDHFNHIPSLTSPPQSTLDARNFRIIISTPKYVLLGTLEALQNLILYFCYIISIVASLEVLMYFTRNAKLKLIPYVTTKGVDVIKLTHSSSYNNNE